MIEGQEGTPVSGQDAVRKSMGFDEFVAYNSTSVAPGEVWTERRQREAYSAYVQTFYAEQIRRRDVYSAYVQHFYTNPKHNEARLLSFDEWEESNYPDKE